MNMVATIRLSREKYLQLEILESDDTFTFAYNPQGLTIEDKSIIDNLYQKMYIEWEREHQPSGAI